MTSRSKTATKTNRKYTRRPKPNEIWVAKCIFAGTPNKEYHYIVPEGQKAQPGDFGVVDTSGSYSGPSHGYAMNSKDYEVKTVKIVGVTQDLSQARKFLVAVVPATALADTKVFNEGIKEKLSILRDARAKLDRLLKEQQEKDRYASLRKNPEAAAALAVLGL